MSQRAPAGSRLAPPGVLVALVVLAVLVVLSGCSGLPAGTEGSTTTLTPVSVPEQTRSVDTGERVLAPGLTAAGVRDPGRLSRAHERALRDRSFTVASNTTVEGPNGTLSREDSRLQVAAGWERYYSSRVAERAPEYSVTVFRPRLELWFDGSVTYFRGTRAGNVTYARQAGSAMGDLSRRDRLYALYASFETRVESTGEGYRVVGTRLTSPAVLNAPLLVEAPRNATFVAVLTPDGRVRRYRVAYDATLDNRRVRLVRRVRFSNVGATDVSQPAWYEEAKNATA